MAPSNSRPASLERLLARGDMVRVERGRLIIISAKGHPIPREWLAENERRLIAEAARAVGAEALVYQGSSVGGYQGGKSPGVTLNLGNLTGEQERYVIFNVNTRYERASRSGNQKAGDPLPTGKFLPGKKSEFLRFWLRAGLTPLNNRSHYCRSLGNLRGATFTGKLQRRDGQLVDGKRIDAKSLALLNIEHSELMEWLAGQGHLATSGSVPNTHLSRTLDVPNVYLSCVPKESPESHTVRDPEPNPTTGPKSHGNTVTSKGGKKGSPTPIQDQSIEQWAKEFA